MHLVIVALIVAVMLFEYLLFLGLLPQMFSYVPEILGLAACAFVVLMGVQSRFQYVRPIYWLVFGALGLVVICGAVVNLLESGPLFAGIRNYLRALPFFFLPAVLLFKEREVRVQLLLLLAFCVMQAPLALSQRIGPGANASTEGDSIIGTMMDSGFLTIFLIAAACVLTGVYLRRIISIRLYLVVLLLMLVPTTINETKVTLLMLPVALMVTFYAGSARGTRLRNMLLGLTLIAGFLAVFVPIYDYFIAPRWGYGILDYFLMEGRVERHLLRGTEIGDQTAAGRLDGIVVALSELSKDPSKLVFGFGIGNTSESALGAQFEGAYYEVFAAFPPSTLRNLLLECGVLGVGLVLLLHWLIFRDSLALAKRDRGLVGAFAAGWAGATTVVVLAFPYTELITRPASSYLYWYFSGLVVASLVRGVLSVDVSAQDAATSSSVVRGGQHGPLVQGRSASGSG